MCINWVLAGKEWCSTSPAQLLINAPAILLRPQTLHAQKKQNPSKFTRASVLIKFPMAWLQGEPDTPDFFNLLPFSTAEIAILHALKFNAHQAQESLEWISREGGAPTPQLFSTWSQPSYLGSWPSKLNSGGTRQAVIFCYYSSNVPPFLKHAQSPFSHPFPLHSTTCSFYINLSNRQCGPCPPLSWVLQTPLHTRTLGSTWVLLCRRHLRDFLPWSFKAFSGSSTAFLSPCSPTS